MTKPHTVGRRRVFAKGGWLCRASVLLAVAALSTVPLPLASGASAAVTQPAISAGGDHTCALTSAGKVYCWGDNSFGQLGNGSSSSSSKPVEVVGVGGSGALSGVTAISAGWDHTCALTSAGNVDCWGDNAFGALGNGGSSSSSSTPVEVVGVGGNGVLSGVTAIGAGKYHTCALSAGNVDCWGINQSGQLGNPNTTFPGSSTPVEVVGVGGNGFLSGVTAISAGLANMCALTSSGNVDCWGYNVYPEDQFGTIGSSTPVEVVGIGGSGALSGVTAITTGAYSTCALSGGNIYCWGDNSFGQLGNGTTTPSSTPAEVLEAGGSGALSGVTAIGVELHACALTSAGNVYCWGYNPDGELGNGTPTTTFPYGRSTPVEVVGIGASGLLSGVTAISAGYNHTCALTSAGSLACWGDNSFGQLGNGTTRSSSTPLLALLLLRRGELRPDRGSGGGSLARDRTAPATAVKAVQVYVSQLRKALREVG